MWTRELVVQNQIAVARAAVGTCDSQQRETWHRLRRRAALHQLAHQAYDDHTKTARMHRIGARPDAAEIARRADAVGATTDSNSGARRRQRDGCTTRPRRNWQEAKEEKEERYASMAYLQ